MSSPNLSNYLKYLAIILLLILSPKLRSQMPKNALIGYWHNWNSTDAKYILLDKIDPRYNVIEVAFALPTSNTDMTMNFIPEIVSKSELISQIQLLQSKGKKVLISVGGATAYIDIKDNAQFDNFVTSMNNIIETYGFDGIDIDIEHGNSIIITSGSTIVSPNNQSMINLINAVKSIMSNYRTKYSKKMLLTMAPETAYVQGGQSGFGSIWGGYLPIIHALRDSIDVLQVQLYNSGSMYGIDNNIYEQGNSDFIVAMTEAVIHGFNTAGGWFTGLPSHKIAVGLPACSSAAGGGFVDTSNVKKAMQYLIGNGPKVGSYSLDSINGYKNLTKMMTWSINWDSMSTCANSYEYADNYENIFDCNSPIISNDLQNKTACENESVTFSVTTDGDDFNYKWYHNNILISNSPNSNIYIIDDVNLSNSGTYNVEISNSCGKSISSNSSILNVIEKLKIITTSDDLLLCEGEEAELKVSAAGNKLTYQWKKESSNLLGKNNSILILPLVSAKDIGKYSCEIKDSCGNILKSEIIKIDVIKKVSIISQSKDSTICEGSNIELSLIADGNVLSYQWRKGNNDLIGENKSVLIINNLSNNDEGDYFCDITDSCGNSISTERIELKIIKSPEILLEINDLTFFENDSLYLEIIALGENLKYSWYKDNEIIKKNDEAFLRISKLSLIDSGYYYCSVSNECGAVISKEFKVNVRKSISEAKLVLSKPLISCDSISIDKFNSNLFENIIKNIGESDLIINSIDLNGKDKDCFTLNDLKFPITLKTNETLNLNINFLGKSEGLKESELVINSNSEKNEILRLNGFVVFTNIQYPLGVFFDNSEIDSESFQTIKIENNSNIDLIFNTNLNGKSCSDLFLEAYTFIVNQNSNYDLVLNYKRSSNQNPKCNLILKNKWVNDIEIETSFAISSVHNLELVKNVQLTPNPATDEISLINLPYNSLVNIYSIYGERMNINIYDNNKLNVTSLSAGVYYCKITSNEIVYTKKFILVK